MKEDLSGWVKCYGDCGSYMWRTHKPNVQSYHTFIRYSCKVCDYRSTIARYKSQFQLDLFNKVSSGNKWVRDIEDRSAERIGRTMGWVIRSLDLDTVLKIYEEVFTAHVDMVTRLWVRNLRLELSSQRQ